VRKDNGFVRQEGPRDRMKERDFDVVVPWSGSRLLRWSSISCTASTTFGAELHSCREFIETHFKEDTPGTFFEM
jgi:hypothetical protein